ncbi:hypothetical protein [Flavobacterium piscisymbiosum]|uniref:Uncharacterized protein n=1 Tax=Flavobacterium piscisymbiosum TaxID=2893753 RepID=A0ABS8MDS8_9FLAO|nr:hypothetical protein [Flavobacterium sp. F-30]MCC9063655.1 hypothetical protein [Flavobacterium sp. F-30]
MKNLLFISLTILFCSCSTDDFAYSETQINPRASVLDSLEVNSNFHYESNKNGLPRKIKVRNQILIVPERISDQIISLVNHGQSKAGSGKFDNQTLSKDTIVMETTPVVALFAIVEESLLGISLQENVKNYIVSLNALKGQDYGIVDDYIIQYEIGKRADQSLSVDEKNTILSISSVSETVLYSEKKRRDRDWETSTTSKKRE